MRAEQASAYAIAHGGATFKICPVCEEHFVYPIDVVLAVLDRQIEDHVTVHTSIDILAAAANWRDRAITAEERNTRALAELTT